MLGFFLENLGNFAILGLVILCVWWIRTLPPKPKSPKQKLMGILDGNGCLHASIDLSSHTKGIAGSWNIKVCPVPQEIEGQS